MRRAPAWNHLISEKNTNSIGESRGGWRLSGALLPTRRGWITDRPFKDLQLEAAELITAYITAYNSETSSAIRSTFLVGLQYSELFVRPLLLLWNAFWYVGRLLGFDVILPMLVESQEVAGKTLNHQPSTLNPQP